MKFSALCAAVAYGGTALAATQPNFAVILTDDQDARMESMNYLQGVNTYITQQGTTFPQHYCTVALCCPSRVNMWTGKAAHNTNVTDLQPPYGGYPKFISEGWNTKWLPVWLQSAGYKTYFTGKLMNYHNINNYAAEVDNLGLDGHDFMLEPGTYQYLNTTLQHNDEEPVSYPGLYATDLLANVSLDWLDVAAGQDAPFFLAINPANPHANLNWSTQQLTDPISAPRYADLFTDVLVPRTENFNPNVSSGASWILGLDQLNDTEVFFQDKHYRLRLQALQAVDDMVNRTIAKLDSLGILDNTYVIFTSDNGFHLGQHRLTGGKRCPYEEDVNVPLVIRGPGVPKGQIAQYVTSHTDITPTILHWAGASAPIDLDGSPIPIDGLTNETRQNFEHAAIEYWGEAQDDPQQAIPEETTINTYKAIRVISADYNLYYSVWCDGSHEVYDMSNDIDQMNNLYNTSGTLVGVTIDKLQDRLDALTLVLKTCNGDTCTDPWSALQPNSTVETLKDALNPAYDTFYRTQNKVKYEECEPAYFIENEQPVNYSTYGNNSSKRRRNLEFGEWQLHVG